jgi:hypothetical protein
MNAQNAVHAPRTAPVGKVGLFEILVQPQDDGAHDDGGMGRELER